MTIIRLRDKSRGIIVARFVQKPAILARVRAKKLRAGSIIFRQNDRHTTARQIQQLARFLPEQLYYYEWGGGTLHGIQGMIQWGLYDANFMLNNCDKGSS